MNGTDKFKIKNTGSLITDAGLDPRLERALKEFGFQTLPQLYAAMKGSPDAFAELFKDFGLCYGDVLTNIESHLTQDEKSRAEKPDVSYGFGHLGGEKSSGRNVIRRRPDA